MAKGTNMSEKKVFRSKKNGIIIIVILASLYVMSFMTCTVAFFTPYWSKNVTLGFYGNCRTVGLVSGSCRFPYSDITGKDYVLGEYFFISNLFTSRYSSVGGAKDS